jgi:asparagine synthase (glutamine-hydrolysing)
LSESRLRRDGILDARVVRDEWEGHLAGGRRWKYQIWAVLMFQAWLDAMDGA